MRAGRAMRACILGLAGIVAYNVLAAGLEAGALLWGNVALSLAAATFAVGAIRLIAGWLAEIEAP